MKRALIPALLSLGLAFGLTGCTKSGNEIRVGEYGSLTGNEATFGLSTNKGIRMAVEDINEKGGVKGRKIKLITLDDQGKDTEAVQAVTRLITQENVVAVLGEVASSRSKAAAPIAQEYKIPMITPSSTNPEVTKIGDQIFRVCFIDSFQGYVMAKFATDNLKLKKVAVLRDVKSDYSVGLSDVFTADFKKMGGEIVGDLSYQSGDVDFKAQLTQIRSKNPDGIYIPGYYTEIGLIAKQARALGLKIPLMGGDGWDSAKLSEIGGDAVNGSYFSNHYSSESTDPAVQDFIARFKTKYNETPDALAAMAFDAARVLIAAMEKAPDLQPKSIRDEIAKTKDFAGITGKITINEHRDAVKSAAIVQVNGATNKFVTTIAPQ